MGLSKTHLLNVFFLKLWFNIKSEVSKTYLQFLWWVLEPCLMVSIFYLVFGVFFSNGADDYIIFLLCGNIPYFWFSKSVMNSTNAVIDGGTLINQVALPKAIFPMLVVFQDLVKQIVVFACLIVFFSIYGVDTNEFWIYLPIIILTQLLLIVAASLLVAGITPFFPDLKFLVDTGLLILMFSSGVFFRYQDVIPDKFHDLYFLNPIAALLMNYRNVIIYSSPPDWSSLMLMAASSLVVIAVLLVFYRRNETRYARIVAK
jgi:lipopolysaccharide transport system permease protein